MTALVLGAIATSLLALAPSARAASPALRVSLTPYPTNFTPDTVNSPTSNLPEYVVSVINVGSAPTTSPISATVSLPAGITERGTGLQTVTLDQSDFLFPVAQSTGIRNTKLFPGLETPAILPVDVGALPEGPLTATVEVSGGGAPSARASSTTTIAAAAAPFGFLPGAGALAGALTDSSGSAVTQAGAHPYQLTLDLGLTSFDTGQGIGQSPLAGPDGGPRDLGVTLPPGLVVDPGATPVRCTEQELVTASCPDASAIGIIAPKTAVLSNEQAFPDQSPLYNMVPPLGRPAEFAANVGGTDVFIHLFGGVHAGDYALAADTPDIISRSGQQVFGAEVELWGDPAAPAHDTLRGPCLIRNTGGQAPPDSNPATCPVPAANHALLTLPTACRDSLQVDASTDSWGNPGSFVARSAQLADQNGDPTPVSGCSGLDFSPLIDLHPTTAQADSSSGIDVDLQIPQSSSLDSLAEANLKKAVVTLPQGVALNPSAADGLAGCTEAQIGLTSESPIAFDNADPTCPNGSKVGGGTIDTPLLPDPLAVDLYLADPNDNPFHSLLSGYLVARGSGVTIKLAARFDRDPDSGQITATVDNNPQLPFSDLKLHFKGGDRGVIVTPPECGTYTINSDLVPWSAQDPNNPTPAEVVHRSNTFDVTAGPNGGPCPDPARFNPGLTAGTLTPLAGSYSPFVLRLSRDSGSQRLRALNVTLPPGLSAKLASVQECSEAQIAVAKSREDELGQGALEKASPSCPAASELGVVNVGAGSGSPIYVQGHVFLAGPYKGAPLSLAIVTPAIAGPFDLGTVVVRSALYVDESTAQVTVKSDPIPTILQGIPLNVRSIAVQINREQFTLNPTSCEEMHVTGEGFSTAGQRARLDNRFQVGGCAGLAFKPKLALKLTGPTRRSGNPALRATLTMPPGGANIAQASVTLPHSEFLDQAHIRTVCTRVQFNAGAGNGTGCPAGSVYGKARAFTPLLDQPLEGQVYLRSSDNPLPDLVAALHGQIRIALVGRIDSVRGGIRTSFERVPDAPVSKFVLSMQGGKKGLLENSRNICKGVNKASVQMDGQNGKAYDTKPVLKVKCPKKKPTRQRRGGQRR